MGGTYHDAPCERWQCLLHWRTPQLRRRYTVSSVGAFLSACGSDFPASEGAGTPEDAMTKEHDDQSAYQPRPRRYGDAHCALTSLKQCKN